MLRLFMPIVFFVLFIIWVLYHSFVKKDIKAQSNNVVIGLSFFSVWAILYWMLV
jgi:hypothetical protein